MRLPVVARQRWSIALLLPVVVQVASGPMPAAAQAPPPPSLPPSYAVEDEIEIPGDDGPRAVRASTDPTGPPPECVWERVPEQALFAVGEQIAVPPMPAPDAYPTVYMCNGAWAGGAENFQWAVPGVPAGPVMTADELAQTIYARLEGNLPAPVVASDPPAGEAAIITYPTFVSVSNWTGTVTDEECDPTGQLCVSVLATPSLTFSPGEPSAPTIACAGSGTSFVEDGSSSTAQAAAPGACAYAYQSRTGAGDRPTAWPGSVTVTWDLVWSSTAGDGGPLPDVVKSAGVARQVNEVQTVIDR
jgi:hypothetical protein